MSYSSRQDLGLLALRVGVGGTLLAHGTQKLFGLFGGGGIAGTTGAMQAMGFLPPKPSAVMAGLGETTGGALLALGAATPVGGAAAMSTMIAAGAVHKPAGFFNINGGFEYPYVLGLIGASLAITGPGHYSVDSVLEDRLNQAWMPAAALTVLGAAGVALVSKRAKALASAATPTAPDQVAQAESTQGEAREA